jgi:hypothetical protein
MRHAPCPIPCLRRPERLGGALACGSLLAFLAGCGGGGDAAAGAKALGAERGGSVQAPLHLFLPDTGRRGLVGLAMLEPDAGQALPGPVVPLPAATGENVQLDRARDELYLIAGRTVLVYAHASLLRPNAAPARSFTLPDTLAAPHALFLDVARDELYVGGDTVHGSGEIVAYPYAHALRGSPATPSRALFVDHGVSFFTIDPVRERLYVVNADAGVHVFASVDTASGPQQPVATVPVLGSGLAVDPARDRLYVVDMFAGLILVDHASAPAPVVRATVSIDDAHQVAIDPARDRVYVSALGALYTLDEASALTDSSTVNQPAVAGSSSAMLGAVAVR